MGDGEGGWKGSNKERIVITGASGFIGSHLVPAVVGADHEIACILEPGAKNLLVGSRTFSVDITTDRGLSDVLIGAKVVIHLAARNHVLQETVKDPISEYRRINVEGTRNVVRAAKKQGVALFVHFSSIKVMGGTGAFLRNGSPAFYPYGISKMESEEVVGPRWTGWRWRGIIRLPMVMGREQGEPSARSWADRGCRSAPAGQSSKHGVRRECGSRGEGSDGVPPHEWRVFKDLYRQG
jgi:nucleoside-diphosphate-sugar epimerase